jgi:solute carrier family 40 (iron-regulated transporter), member 1
VNLPHENRSGASFQPRSRAMADQAPRSASLPAEQLTTENASTVTATIPPGLPKGLSTRLFTSHFLSTWNSRLFEFGSVLFLADIFPGTLLPLSVYALARGAAAVLFAAPLGAAIDRRDRLAVVRASIVAQRAAVAASCGVFAAMAAAPGLVGGAGGTRAGQGLLAAAALLACVEKLAAVANLVAVERDWVVVVTEGDEGARRLLNARMRRIDLACKLLGPLVVSSVASASTLAAIWATLAMNVLSIPAEYICIAGVRGFCAKQNPQSFQFQALTPSQVYKMVPGLQRARQPRPDEIELQEPTAAAREEDRSTLRSILPLSALPLYFHHPAFLPSFSLSLLYLTVLSFSGQMLTYLLASGYTALQAGAARTASSVFELTATWLAPRLVRRIGPVRGGIWSLTWQMVWLAGGASWFFTDLHREGREMLAATGLVVGVAVSRVGLWGFDLCAQNIVQDVSLSAMYLAMVLPREARLFLT